MPDLWEYKVEIPLPVWRAMYQTLNQAKEVLELYRDNESLMDALLVTINAALDLPETPASIRDKLQTAL